MRYKNYFGQMPPNFISEFLVSLGGKNPAKDPLYRLVMAGKVLEWKGERWHDWDPSIPVEDRGVPRLFDEHGHPIGSNLRPQRVVAEVREVQKYPQFEDDAWVLERWMPGSYYGTEAKWYSSELCLDGTSIPRLGPYPSDGQYEFVGGPFKHMPTLSFLSDQIGWLERNAEKVAERAGKSVKARVEEATAKEMKRQDDHAAENAYQIREFMSPANTISLAAGRWRNEIAQKYGIGSHMGN